MVDINSPEKVIHARNKYGVDGVMIGRAAIGYPWIFNEIKHFMKQVIMRLHHFN